MQKIRFKKNLLDQSNKKYISRIEEKLIKKKEGVKFK